MQDLDFFSAHSSTHVIVYNRSILILLCRFSYSAKQKVQNFEQGNQMIMVNQENNHIHYSTVSIVVMTNTSPLTFI